MLKDLEKFSEEKLCDIIVCSRHLGTLQEEAVECMKELARRRESGSLFDYETYISEKIKVLPEFKLDLKKKMNLGLDFSFLKGMARK